MTSVSGAAPINDLAGAYMLDSTLFEGVRRGDVCVASFAGRALPVTGVRRLNCVRGRTPRKERTRFPFSRWAILR
jgi:hypothetical protein